MPISITDPSLRNISQLSELSIQVSPDGFSFCVLSYNHRLKAFHHYPFKDVVLFEDLLSQIQSVLKRDALLHKQAEVVRIIHTGRNSTLLPDEFTKPESLKKILNFNQPIDELDEIHLNKIDGCELSLVFSVHHYITSLFTGRYENITYFNQATPLLHHVLKKPRKGTEVFIQLNTEFFDIVIMKSGELKLYNSFLYVDSTDLIYFILYACKQLKVDPKRAAFHFIGDFSKKLQLYNELESYLPNCSKLFWGDITHHTQFSAKVDTSRFFSLLNLHLCAL